VDFFWGRNVPFLSLLLLGWWYAAAKSFVKEVVLIIQIHMRESFHFSVALLKLRVRGGGG